jgi:hypothetical protein
MSRTVIIFTVGTVLVGACLAPLLGAWTALAGLFLGLALMAYGVLAKEEDSTDATFFNGLRQIRASAAQSTQSAPEKPKPHIPKGARFLERLNAIHQRSTLDRIAEGLAEQARHQKKMAGEWKDLAARFHSIGNHSIRADWDKTGDGEEVWRVCGGDHQTCEALCRLAGATLARSPRVFAAVQENIRLESNHLYRWLSFIKGDAGNMSGMGYAEEKDRDGNSTGIHLYGSIRNLIAVSERVCIDCAATET